MNKITHLLLAASLVFLGGSALAESATVKGAQKDFETFKQEMAVKLEQAQAKLDELQTKAKVKGSNVKEETVTDLRVNRDKLKVQYDELKFESKSRFQRMKTGLSNSIDSLNNRIQKALND